MDVLLPALIIYVNTCLCNIYIMRTDLLESQTLEQYRDWDYNGLKLVPKKVHRPEVIVDALKFQCLLRSAVPRLPSYVELLRANDPQLDALISMENREGL